MYNELQDTKGSRSKLKLQPETFFISQIIKFDFVVLIYSECYLTFSITV